MSKILYIYLILFLSFSIKAQKFWDVSRNFELDILSLNKQIQENQTLSFNLPLPNGEVIPFDFKRGSLLTPKFCAKYPNIICLEGRSSLDKRTTASITIYKDKLYGMVLFPTQTLFINPGLKEDYEVKWKSTLNREKKKNTNSICELDHKESAAEKMIADLTRQNRTTASNLERRKYVMAISTTGEYVSFHGGTKEDALAAIAVTLNRVNSIYERDLNISFTLFDGDGAENLIFIDPILDPYANNNSLNIINRSQDVFDDAIGFENYDIGHVFSTDEGGIATLGSVCGGTKAEGVTGSDSPMGDVFDIDFLAHEIGHQLNAEHTFNGIRQSCANNRSTQKFEPGSGTTIMAYAGICGSDNVQFNSDDYFHTKSIEVIKTFSTTGRGSDCGVTENTGNTDPVITEISISNLVLPVSTPFELVGLATDIDNDLLTYTWEQVDVGPSSTFGVASGNAPLFRSRKPEETGRRTFPILSNVLANISREEEILPDYTRDMSFQVTVRDQLGGIATDDIQLSVTAAAGPFLVNEPAAGSEFLINDFIPVSWDVAGTDANGVNCDLVDIYISYDGGETFSELLMDTPNDGSEMVKLNTITASEETRIKVVGSDHLFFNVNNGDFTISLPDFPDYVINASTSEPELCGSEIIMLQLNTLLLNNFSDSVNYEISFTPDVLSVNNPIGKFDPREGKELVISSNLVENTNVKISINTNSGDLERNFSFALNAFLNINPEPANLISPEINEEGLLFNTSFDWESTEKNSRFILHIENLSTNEIINSDTLLETSDTIALESSTFYKWEVTTVNECGTSISEGRTFSTDEELCFSVNSSVSVNLPLNEMNFSSPIEVRSQGILSSIKVDKLIGTHMYTDDLRFSLVGPGDDEVILFESICNGGFGEDFNLQLESKDDLPSVPCPPIGGETYQPKETLDAFIGSEVQGVWELRILDFFPNLDEGVLNEWGLEICVQENTFITSVNDLNEKQKIYLVPNPASESIEITNYEGTISIFSILGQSIETREVIKGEKVDIASLENGSYFIRLETGDVLPFVKN